MTCSSELALPVASKMVPRNGGLKRTRPTPLEIDAVRIVHHDLAGEVVGDTGGKEIIVVELPMRVIGGKQQEFVRAQMIDDTADDVGGFRRIERLHGQTEMIAVDFQMGGVEPGDLSGQAAPELRHSPLEGRHSNDAGF